MKEIWKDIQDFEGWYQVSNRGRIRSLDRVIKMTTTTNGRTTHYDYHRRGAIKLPGDNTHGYPTCMLSKGDVRTTKLVHRVVATAFIPNPENKGDIDHINNIRNDNNVTNLRWCTRSENLMYASQMGLLTKRNNLQHLDYEDAQKIRRIYASGELSQMKIAKLYNTTQAHVSNIINFRTWVTDTKGVQDDGTLPQFTLRINFEIAEEIRKLYRTGDYTHKDLGEIFGVSEAHAGSIIRGLAWKTNRTSRRTVAKNRRTVLDK